MKINVPANTKTVTLNMVSDEMLELKKKIEQGMTELKLSQSGLSKAIGHSRNYLSECLRVGVSTEKQGVIIGKIDGLLSSIDDEQHYSHWVGKAYHDQEIAKLKAEKMEIIQDVKNAEAHSQKLKEENSKLEEIIDNLVIECAQHKKESDVIFDNYTEVRGVKDGLQKANIDLMNELNIKQKHLNGWRFLAWVTLVVLFVSVCVVVR